MPSDAPSAPPPSDAGPLAYRISAALAASAIGASVAALPSAVRIAAVPGADALHAWGACAGTMVVPMFVAVLIVQRARIGLRPLGGARAVPNALGAAVWLASLFTFLVPFGAALRATTHHHALAGVTFAIVAVAAAIGLGALAARLAAIVAASEAARPAWVVAVSGLLIVLGVAIFFRFSKALAATPDARPEVGAFVDIFAFGIAVFFASHPALFRGGDEERRGRIVRRLAVAGALLAVVLFAFGIASLRGSHAVLDALTDRAPELDPVARALAGR